MRVLVVEDEPLIRLLTIDILEAAGFTVVDASSAGRALEAARDRRFDAAVIDLGLPDAPCTTVVHALLAAQPTLGLVISTGRQERDPQVAAVRCAAGDRVAVVLEKPWATEALVSAVWRAAGLTRAGLRPGGGKPGTLCSLSAS